MKKDSLGDRMKGYENIPRNYLTRRLPVIIRLDGKAFHTFTKGMEKPFDNILIETMADTAKHLCENIQGCKIAYTQSDEISLLLTDYENIDTCAWFDNNIQKMVSISASIATLAFNKSFRDSILKHSEDLQKKGKYDIYFNKLFRAMFDSRVFTLPKEEVTNYFIWRQQDATRNSIQMVGQANFSHKQLHKKSCDDIQEMLFQEKGINWNDLPAPNKRGVCIIKEQYELNNEEKTLRARWAVDFNIPVFTQDRDYIEKYV
ncbi:tRNA(His) guanylyltransferase Thg1 family protein [Tissierella praeacuta]|uniref:tRNA(His) guanylyltransferase Thg1 family protein n=1 Tax=Tissierella praeacuta TaxID=43131 RepID=UPI003DA3AA91